MRLRANAGWCAFARPLCILGLLTLAGCLSLRRPADVALALDTDVRSWDLASAERLGSFSVYTVIASSPLGGAGQDFRGCRPDVGGGVRCTFVPDACGNADDGTLTMHLEEVPRDTYHVTAAAVAGIYRTTVKPDFGTVVYLEPCGLHGLYSEPEYAALDPFLSSEIYSTTLVPWPYSDPPSTRGDTALATSRLATNRRATAAAIADLQQALAAGEDSSRVVTTAVVEAAFTLGLHIATPDDYFFVWNHDAAAYPTDIVRLRDAIALLDFAMGVPHPGIDWRKVAVLGSRGRDITFTHTPSIASMGEMNGIAHYLLGRALMDGASGAQSCTVWMHAYDALTTGHRYLENVPPVDEADDVDARLAKSAALAAQRADSAVARVCRGRPGRPRE